MSEPFLYLFERYAIRVQKAGAAMSQIVIAYPFEIMVIQNDLKVLCDVIRLDALTDRIDVDIVCVVLTVSFTAYLLISLLLTPKPHQKPLKRLYEGQSAMAGLCLGSILSDDYALSIEPYLGYSMLDADGFCG